MLDHDVVVVGGGPVGAAHAAAHAASGRSVGWIGTASALPRGTFELLSGRADRVLRVLGVFDEVRRRAQPCAGTLFRWTREHFLEQTGQNARWDGGWVIDRSWFDPLLRSASAQSDGVTVVDGFVSRVTREGSGWQVEYVPSSATAGETPPGVCRARTLAIASGRTGRLTVRCGIPRRTEHRMVAITTAQPVDLPHLGRRLLVDSAERGWWYAMGNGVEATVGYVTDVDLLDRGPGRIEATWRAAAEGVDWLPEGISTRALQPRAAVVASADLRTSALSPMAMAMAVGDAAFAADPLSGHGLVLGLRGALHAAAEPEDYRSWLRREQESHRQRERLLYASERKYPASVFWSRRDRS